MVQFSSEVAARVSGIIADIINGIHKPVSTPTGAIPLGAIPPGAMP